MKRWIAALVAALGLQACAATPPQVAETVVRIEANNAVCTGTFINTRGLVLTAGHCVAGEGTQVSIILRNGTTLVGTVTLDDDINDIALIRLDTPRQTVYSPLRCDTPAIAGEPVYIIGMPAGRRWVFTAGSVAGVIPVMLARMILLDMRIWFGNSGGGVFDQDGRIVGVVSMIMTYDRDKLTVIYGLAVPIKIVCDKVKNG